MQHSQIPDAMRWGTETIHSVYHREIDMANLTHRPRGLPKLRHWGCPVVEHGKIDYRKYCLYAVFSGLGFRVL